MAEPTSLVADSGIELLTAGTPNGHKVAVLLEELKEAYGKDYTVQSINIFDENIKTQKEPWFTAINPNGRIPAIVDHDRGGFAVFETTAILTYLARQYDPEHKFSFPADSDDYSVSEQWLAWNQGGLTAMQSQVNFFLRFTPNPSEHPYAIQRYVGETERLYGVLNTRLADRDYVAGAGRGRYSIADISLVTVVNVSRFGGIELRRQFPNVQAWLDRILARPAVRKGLAVPGGLMKVLNEALEGAVNGGDGEEAEGLRKVVEEGDRLVKEAKEKFGYVYSSP